MNVIAAELSSAEEVLNDIIVSVEDGTYAGFTIPDGALLPLLGTTYRLVIRSAGSYFPIIDFNQSNDSHYVGADIGSANPNVTIENLRFQYFAVGIRASLNSHSIKINKCIVSNNRNAGILIDQCDNVQVLNSVVSNGDYGVVVRLCKNIALIHNTIFLNGSISTIDGVASSAIWCQLARAYSAGSSGVLTMIGNIAWNLAGTTLSLFIEDIERPSCIVSNYNDFVVGNRHKFISIEDSSFYAGANSRPRAYYTSLNEWKALGYDQNSISEDPKFVVPTKVGSSRSKHAIDLNLLTISPALAKVPSFYNNPTATARWLPSYVSSSDLRSDILNNNRPQSMSAIGANDKESNNGFFGQDILTAPLTSFSPTSCGVDPLFDIIQRKLDLWFPKYKAGYFYSYDREYYLYSRKRCMSIGSLCETTFHLPSRVDIKSPVSLYVNGTLVTNTSYYDIVGNILKLYHKDLDINSWNEEVELRYSVPSWSDSGFTSVETYVRFKINEGTSRFFLTQDYVPGAPVVITDDYAHPSNKDLYTNREFKIQFDEDSSRAEIIFSQNENLVSNAQFDYYMNTPPLQWASTGAYCTSGTYAFDPICGTNVCQISNSGYIEQSFKTNTGESSLSFYGMSTGSSTLTYDLSFYDDYNRDLGYPRSGEIIMSGSWYRYYLTLGTTGATIPIIPETDYSHIFINHLHVPENSKTLVARLSSSGDSLVDAVQYEYKSRPSSFHRKYYGNELTVEYETSDSEYFIDFNQSMSSSIASITDGFLYIPEIPASAFGGPANPAITTLHEWRWKEGRARYLPWSRLSGKDKLRNRMVFHSYPQDRTKIIVPVTSCPEIGQIDLIPSTPVVLQGSTSPCQITLVAYDENENPMAGARVVTYISDSNNEYPGYLHKKLYGAKHQLGQMCYGALDHAGAITVYWYPPSDMECRVVTKVPTPSTSTSSGERMSYIRTKYPVNIDFHGNVSIQDNAGNMLKTKGDSPERGTYQVTRKGEYSTVRLGFPAVPGTITLKVDGVIYTETYTANPETSQYFVDYENSIITINSTNSEVYVEYIPSYVFINRTDPHVVMLFHDRVFNGYTDSITVGHDVIIKLTAQLTDYSNNTTVTKSFEMIANNYMTTLYSNKSNIHLDM